MKNAIFISFVGLGISIGFLFHTPHASAKYKDCWGNWHRGYPGNGACYSIQSITPDNRNQRIPPRKTFRFFNFFSW